MAVACASLRIIKDADQAKKATKTWRQQLSKRCEVMAASDAMKVSYANNTITN